MSKRARRLGFTLGSVVVLLFLGRWTAGLFADRWWAERISPEAARFITEWHLLHLTLEAAGVTIACAWFVGHLLVVYRAIGSVHVPRQVANLEIREALTPRLLILASVGVGALLGVLVGSGVGDWWRPVTLAWSGLRYGEREPLLNHDLGVYVAELPLWRLLHGYALLLVLLAIGGVLTLYILIGSVRWIEGRPAISDYARRHLGLLLTAGALGLVWGYLLEPYEIVAGVRGNVHDGLFRFHLIVSQVLAGAALTTGLLSAIWSWRPRHALLAAGWAVLGFTSILGHHVLPALVGAQPGTVNANTRKRLEARAYGLTGLKDSTVGQTGESAGFASPAALWDSAVVARIGAGDAGELRAAERTVITVAGRPKPAWLILRTRATGRATLYAVADDRTGVTGTPLYYRAGDTLPDPQRVSRLELSPPGVWPGAPDYVIDTTAGGVLAGTGPRRIALAWALQAPDLLGPLSPRTTVFWKLSPDQRLAKLAPYIAWGRPSPRLIGGELLWLADGYLASATFPIANRSTWRGHTVGSLRVGFVGVVHASTGATQIFLRHTADTLAGIWRTLAGGVIQSATDLPPEIGRAVWYPLEQLRIQSRILEGAHWQVGRQVVRSDSAPPARRPLEAIWEEDTTGAEFLVPYTPNDRAWISAVLQARMSDGWESLRVFRLDSASALPPPSTLERSWNRFVTLEQIRDSVRAAGGRWGEGPVHLWLAPAGLGAYQAYFDTVAVAAEPTLAWLSVAFGGRIGAGHNAMEAWQNLRGITAPLVAAGAASTQIEEARRLIAQADSALRKGDMAAFARAWDTLRKVLLPAPARGKKP